MSYFYLTCKLEAILSDNRGFLAPLNLSPAKSIYGMQLLQ